MSTVLWANILVNEKVEIDNADKYYLYKYAKKLDRLTNQLQVSSFISLQDFTDVEFNFSNKELPDGMESTTDVMAKSGVWVDGSVAAEMLEKLIDHISDKDIRFGLLKNSHDEVLYELKESLKWALKAKSENGKFNFSVVT